MKKAVSLLLSLLTVLCFCSAAFAEASTIPLYVDIPAENISVTVSTGGLTSASGAQVSGTITNNGSGTIYVTSATVQAVPSWELVNFSNGNMPFGTKTFGALINGVDAKDEGLTSTFGSLSAGQSAVYTYQAKAARQPVKTNEQVANLVLVFGWSSNGTEPAQTHQVGDMVQNEIGNWKVIDISDNTVTLFCMNPDGYMEMKYDEIAYGINYDSKFADGIEILLSEEQYNTYKDQIVSSIDSSTVWWLQEKCVLNGVVDQPVESAFYIPVVNVPISSVWTD